MSVVFFNCHFLAAQDTVVNRQLYFNEFLGYVKKYHPVVKQADMQISQAQAALMMARGAFDPKIEVDFDKKQFKDTEYYSLLNSSFKIPTWYGIEVKAGFDNSEGMYLNPENTTPNRGLTSLGITVPVGQGLLINQRMADLRMARIQLSLNTAERQIRAANVLYNASVAYFNWKRSNDEVQLYENYLEYAQTRYNGIIRLIEQGDKPAIDSVEAGIVVRNRELSLEDARLKLIKARLEVSNYLWIENVPVELDAGLVPEEALRETVQETLRTNNLAADDAILDNHPKITALQNKIDILDIERRFKSNLLLPRLDIGYHYLSEPGYFNANRFDDYKIGLNFSFPLFLRKERGSLQLAKLKLRDSRLQLGLDRLELQNKIMAMQAELVSLQKQIGLIDILVNDNTFMLRSEERLFTFGESSVFLINARENNLVNARLSQISLENRYLVSNAELFKIMANPD